MFDWLRDLRSVLYEDIIRRKKTAPFIVAVAFLLSFVAARLTVLFGPSWLRLFIHDYHVHHFYYGFVLIAISNWIALTTNRQHMFNLAAAFFGAGLGLFMDEFGLLLTCTSPALECNYYAQQTYDGILLLFGFFFAVIYSRPMVSKLKSVFNWLLRRRHGGGEI